MKIIEHPQGSVEWLAHRAQHFNASDAPAMLGVSPYKTRAQLLREMHTGVSVDVDIATQKRFDNGHRAEALARPIAERIIGEDLYPVVGTEGRLSASFDGLTLDERTAFEHKALNDELRAAFRAIEAGADQEALPIYHRAQMEQQLTVSGAERVLFMSSSFDAAGELLEEHHCWYYPDDEMRGRILQGWVQFAADLADYKLPDATPEPARAEQLESLPAVSVRLDGALSVVGNLPSFAVALREFVAKIPQRPATDTEFATTEAACKALKRAEEALDAAEAGALASITDVDAMRRAVADCRKLARDTRLAAEKMVERRKLEIKESAVMAARKALDTHIAALNAELAPFRIPPIAADFAGTIKGLKSVASMQDKLDGLLATTKIAAEVEARAIRGNVTTFKQEAEGHEFLFADLGQIISRPADDFRALVQGRIAQHKVAEAERERKKREAEELARQQAEAAAAAALAAAKQKETTPPANAGGAPGAVAAPADAAPKAAREAENPAQQREAAPRPDEPATLKLGTICERLGFTVSASFMADVLRVAPAKAEGRAMLYRESQFPVICRQLQSHVSAMAELYAGEVA